FRDIWDYRFLYRDRLSAVSNDAHLNRRIQVLLERNYGLVEQILVEMERRKLLRASARQISRLAVNTQLICRYWIDYVQSREGPEALTEQHINSGLEQVFSLFQPYLLPPNSPDRA
ncbi:MAG TPA: TetR/AcrR family transcriptional regulator, partial [bacterium]|nr:TetR/AcrR family transcriptional regulator [bacterium]